MDLCLFLSTPSLDRTVISSSRSFQAGTSTWLDISQPAMIVDFILYSVCVYFFNPQSQWNDKQCDKGCKGGRNNKEWLQNSSFSLFPNVTPSLWTLYFCSCPQHMYQNSGSFYFPQRIIKVSMIFSHIYLFLSHFCDISILYCDLRRLPNSVSSSPSHQEDKSSWFFKKGLWKLWSDSCN